jgi:hypothetical protein
MPYYDGHAITKYSWRPDGSLKEGFKQKEDPLDHWPSDIWGHGKRGCLPEARGTGDGPGRKLEDTKVRERGGIIGYRWRNPDGEEAPEGNGGKF